MAFKGIKSKIAALFLACGLVAGVSIVTAPAASALPNGCKFLNHKVPNMQGKVSYCSGGTGYHRIALFCRETKGGPTYWVYGPWAKPGDYSIAACLLDDVNGFLTSYHRSVIDPA